MDSPQASAPPPYQQSGRRSDESVDSQVELTSVHDNHHQYDVESDPHGSLGSPGPSFTAAHHDHVEEADTPQGSTKKEWTMWADKNFVHEMMIVVLLVVAWYTFSISISVYNKWMFGDSQLKFNFPLFTTAFHMLVQFGLASLGLYLRPDLRPRAASQEGKNLDDPETPQSRKPVMAMSYYASRIVPCAVATSLDIGLGNTSLRFITLSFFTMVKSSTLFFVLGFAILFGLEKFSLQLAGVILLMMAGVVLMVFGEAAFNIVGFLLLITASACSGIRWSVTQILLKRNPATSNPIASLYYLTPVMFVALLVLAIMVEGFGPLFEGLAALAAEKGTALTILMLIFPGCLAFAMTVSEFGLLLRTSVVTLSVCGIFKEVLTIGFGSAIFGDVMTPINISGLLLTILAIAMYNIIRVRKMNTSRVRGLQNETVEERAPMLSTTDRFDISTDPVRRNRTLSTADLISRGLGTSDSDPHPATSHRKTSVSSTQKHSQPT